MQLDTHDGNKDLSPKRVLAIWAKADLLQINSRPDCYAPNNSWFVFAHFVPQCLAEQLLL